MSMRRLLNESEFAKTWRVDLPGYKRNSTSDKPGINFNYFCEQCDDMRMVPLIIAKLTYEIKDNTTILSSLIIHNTDLVDKFIEDYNVEPYTYIYCINRNIPQNIKPFTYYVSYNIIADNITSSPLCVVYDGSYNIDSVLKERDEEMEYAVAKKLQNGEPLTKLKSARN